MKYNIVDVMRNRFSKKFFVSIKHEVAIGDGMNNTTPSRFGFMYYPETISDKTAVKKLIKFMIGLLQEEKKKCDRIIGELQDVQQKWLVEESKKRKGAS